MSPGSDRPRTPELIDYLLGEGDADARRDARRELTEDLEVATEVGELRQLFEGMRSVTIEPSGRVPLAVRYAVLRRNELRGAGGLGPAPPPGARLRYGLHVAAAALVWLGISVFAFGRGERTVTPVTGPVVALAVPGAPSLTAAPTRHTHAADPELGPLLDTDNVPVRAAGFLEALRRFDSVAVPDGFGGWLSAENQIARLRAEYTLRQSPGARRHARRVTGSPDLEDRIAVLADTVAGRLAARIADLHDPGALETAEVAIAMRALLATGSTPDAGPHREVVRDSLRLLSNRLPQLDGGALATALAALTDLAVVHQGPVAERIAVHGDRLARETLRGQERGRPGLLHWRTPLGALADAGRVFELAPAFGVHAGLAFRARLMVAAHLEERFSEHREEEAPALIAAQLYGFGDLIDRRTADLRLLLWRPRFLLPDYVALHHVAWGKYPVRSGWADFQSELRGIAGLPTPDGVRDAAALLLCLAVNAAAPGVLESWPIDRA